MATSLQNLVTELKSATTQTDASDKNFEGAVHRPDVMLDFVKFTSEIQNFVAMATSLENLSNIIEIPDYDNPTLAANILKLRCTGPELLSILCNFGS